MREVFGTVIRAPGDYSREYDIEFGLTYARLAKMLADQGFVTVEIATISMFEGRFIFGIEKIRIITSGNLFGFAVSCAPTP